MKTNSRSSTGGAGGSNSNAGGAGGTGQSSDDNAEGDDDGGAGDDDDGGDGGGGDEPVSRADHQRAVNDMLRFKTKARSLESTVGDLQRQIEELRTKGDQGGGDGKTDWKALYERTKGELETERTKGGELKTSVVYNERYRAVLPLLQEAGLRKDAVTLLDKETLDDLEIEATSNGRFIVHGAESYVDEFKKRYPYAFNQKKAPNVNAGGGRGGSGGTGSWNPTKLYNLERECKRKGDMSPYHRAVGEWVKAGKPAQ